ncbi:MAG: hypothetical protein ACWGNP_03285, partial [Candidatus Bathyarchaeia archaeon]
MENSLTRIRGTADYQFGKGLGAKLFPENVDIEYSKATGRIRYVYLNGERLATLRPTDGLLSLSIIAAQIVAKNRGSAKCFVTVQNDVSKYIADGGDVFAVHVASVDEEILAELSEAGVNEFDLLFIDGYTAGESIRKTLLMDKVETKEEALIEIYRRLRPGNPATPEVAQDFVDNLFFKSTYYDLSGVGRLKINQRLGQKDPINKKTRV